MSIESEENMEFNFFSDYYGLFNGELLCQINKQFF